MSYCLNPACPNPDGNRADGSEPIDYCKACGSLLLLCDRYRALQPLTEDGIFGQTFLGVDRQRPSNPHCIIKQFSVTSSNHLDPSQAARRFHQEAIHLDQLGQHPQIPTLLAYFQQDGRWYLIQEYVEGQPLERLLQETGPFSEKQVWRLLADLLSVLEFVHNRHAIHRDIRPANIIHRASDNRFVLLGFGSAKIATLSVLQETATILAPSIYTPPEQLIGRPLFASDLYSLGVSCLHALEGQEPKQFFDPQDREWQGLETLSQPPSPALAAVLHKLVCGNLQNRYQSAAVVLQEVLKQTSLTTEGENYCPIPVPIIYSISPSKSLVSSTLRDRERWQCDRTLNAHQSWVRAIAISSDNRYIVSGSKDKTVKIWHLQTGDLIHNCIGHTAWVNAIAISPDNQLIASASNDQTVRLWQMETGELLNEFAKHEAWVRAVAFFPPKAKTAPSSDWTLISSGHDNHIKLWSSSHLDKEGVLTGHQNWVLSLATSPDGHTFASGSNDRTIGLWDLGTSEAYHFLSGHTDKVLAVAISSNGSMLASSSADRTIKLWNLNTGSLLATLTGHANAVNTICFSPDGKILASGSSDTTIKLWDLDNGQTIDTLSGHGGQVWSLTYSPDGNTLASGSEDGTIKLWRKLPVASAQATANS